MARNIQKFRNWRWWTVVLRGVAAIAFGLISLARPGVALLSLVILFGIFAIADGVLALSLGAGALVSRGAMYGRGIVSIVAGVLALAMPQMTGIVLIALIGAWAIVAGIFELVMAFRLRHEIQGEWLLGIEGALSIAFGVLLFISPLAGAVAIGLWVGAYALILGGMMVATGLRLRQVDHVLLPHASAA